MTTRPRRWQAPSFWISHCFGVSEPPRPFAVHDVRFSALWRWCDKGRNLAEKSLSTEQAVCRFVNTTTVIIGQNGRCSRRLGCLNFTQKNMFSEKKTATNLLKVLNSWEWVFHTLHKVALCAQTRGHSCVLEQMWMFCDKFAPSTKPNGNRPLHRMVTVQCRYHLIYTVSDYHSNIWLIIYPTCFCLFTGKNWALIPLWTPGLFKMKPTIFVWVIFFVVIVEFETSVGKSKIGFVCRKHSFCKMPGPWRSWIFWLFSRAESERFQILLKSYTPSLSRIPTFEVTSNQQKCVFKQFSEIISQNIPVLLFVSLRGAVWILQWKSI